MGGSRRAGEWRSAAGAWEGSAHQEGKLENTCTRMSEPLGFLAPHPVLGQRCCFSSAAPAAVWLSLQEGPQTPRRTCRSPGAALGRGSWKREGRAEQQLTLTSGVCGSPESSRKALLRRS